MARSAELLQKLLDADHGNAIYRRGQSVVEAQWAAALRGAGQISAAVAHNERALQLAQGLNKDAPGSVQYRSDLGNDERKLSEGLVAAGNAVGALHHAEQAEQILCQNDPGSTDPNGLANCGRSLLAAGNADRALRNPKAAVTAFRKAVEIASARSEADPPNAVFRSDSARAQAALAGALAATGDNQGARLMYEGALKTWSVMRQAKSISAEDSHRSEAAGQALANLQSNR
jgi:tetratricopeptide (TPR) repeat protein